MIQGRLAIKKTHPDAQLPRRATAGAAGYDLFALEDVVWSGATIAVRTGIALAIPDGYYGRIAERSSLALGGIQVGGGVIDSDYRGEIKVILMRPYDGRLELPPTLPKGCRLAQLIIEPCVHPAMCEVAEFSAELTTARDEGGFGSTGQ